MLPDSQDKEGVIVLGDDGACICTMIGFVQAVLANVLSLCWGLRAILCQDGRTRPVMTSFGGCDCVYDLNRVPSRDGSTQKVGVLVVLLVMSIGTSKIRCRDATMSGHLGYSGWKVPLVGCACAHCNYSPD